MIDDLIKPMKERVRFLVEHRTLFHATIRDDSDQTTSETHAHPSYNNSQQLLEKDGFNSIKT